MAQQIDVPCEPLDMDSLDINALSGRSYTIGRRLSQLFHPIALGILSFLIVGYYSASSIAGLQWSGLCILTLVLPTTVFYSLRLRQGVYSDEDISRRHERNEMYVFALVSVLIGTILLAVLGAPHPFLALMVGSLALGMLAGFINLFWKISVHSAAIASTATIALIYSRGLGLTLWICALIVGWAR